MKLFTMTHNLLTQKCTAMLGMLLLLLFAVVPQVAQAQTDGDAASTETDERLQAFTLDGVTLKIEDSAEYPWTYDAKNGRLQSSNYKKANSESSIKLTFNAVQSFCLRFNYGVSCVERYAKASILIDGNIFNVISTPSLSMQTFSYVFDDGGEHVIELRYVNRYGVTDGFDRAYLSNVVATTEVEGKENTTTFFAALDDKNESVNLSYAPIKLPCLDLTGLYIQDVIPDDYKKKTITINESVKGYAPTNLKEFFKYFSPTSIIGLANLNTSLVTDMSYMFSGCSSLKSLDLSEFNTEKVTNMSFMFYNCSGLKDLDLSKFNTEKVTNMSCMFYQCFGLESLDLSKFNTEKVTNMSYMFEGCLGLTRIDLSPSFKTLNVTNMSELFYRCSGLTSIDLSSFNTKNVENMSYMFYCCSSLTSLDVSKFNTEKVYNMSNLFGGCSGLTILDLSSFNTENVSNISGVFSGCSGLTSIDLSKFNTEKVSNMSAMFRGCSGLTSLDLSSFKTGNVTTMQSIFENCSGLTSLDLSPFDMRNVTNMSYMFRDCSGLTSLDLSVFNTEKVTTMSYMFRGCSGLTSLDLSVFNTEKVTSMSNMFSGCTGLTSLDLSVFNTEEVTNMSNMFSGCTGLTSLDLSSFDTEKVTNMQQMFNNCSGLTTIFVSDKFNKLGNRTDGMFGGCTSLVGAIPYDSRKEPSEVANYQTGYFKTYYQVGDVKHELFGEELKVDDLVLEDGKDFKAAAPFTATNVTYSREVKSATTGRLRGAISRWGSICLPYAITAPANCQLYTLSGVQMDNTTNEGTIIMEEVDQLEAGMPAFYCVKDASVTSVNFNASDANIVNTLVDNSANTVDGVYLKGTYTTQAIDEGYVLMNNSMWNAATVKAQNSGKTVNSKGLRAYLALAPNASAAAQKLNFDAKETTGIESVINVMNDADAEIYDASGRRQGSIQRGLNIIRKANGKSVKVMVK